MRRPATPPPDPTAQHPHTQAVAIKKLRPFSHPKEALRAYREIRMLQFLRHPNIIALTGKIVG